MLRYVCCRYSRSICIMCVRTRLGRILLLYRYCKKMLQLIGYAYCTRSTPLNHKQVLIKNCDAHSRVNKNGPEMARGRKISFYCHN